MSDDPNSRSIARKLIAVQCRMLEIQLEICKTHLRILDMEMTGTRQEALDTARELLKILTENQDILEARIKDLHKGTT